MKERRGRVDAAKGCLTLPNNGGIPRCNGEGVARSTSLATFNVALKPSRESLQTNKEPFAVHPTSRQSSVLNTPYPGQGLAGQTNLPRSTSLGTLVQSSPSLPVPDPIPPLLHQNTHGPSVNLPRKPLAQTEDSFGILRSSSMANMPSSTQSLFSLRSQSRSPGRGQSAPKTKLDLPYEGVNENIQIERCWKVSKTQ